MSLREIVAELARRGHLNELGNPFNPHQSNRCWRKTDSSSQVIRCGWRVRRSLTRKVPSVVLCGILLSINCRLETCHECALAGSDLAWRRSIRGHDPGQRMKFWDSQGTRFATQRAIKRLARSVGLEVRYAFQNPPITFAGIYAPW